MKSLQSGLFPVKACVECGVVYIEVNAFFKYKSKKENIFRDVCRKCDKKSIGRRYREKNAEKIKKGQKEHYEKNKEKIKKYRKKNKEKIKEGKRKY